MLITPRVLSTFAFNSSSSSRFASSSAGEFGLGTILGAGGKLERGRVETERSRKRTEPVATVARARERDSRVPLKLRVDQTCGADEPDRGAVVVRDMLGMVFSTAET